MNVIMRLWLVFIGKDYLVFVLKSFLKTIILVPSVINKNKEEDETERINGRLITLVLSIQQFSVGVFLPVICTVLLLLLLIKNSKQRFEKKNDSIIRFRYNVKKLIEDKKN